MRRSSPYTPTLSYMEGATMVKATSDNVYEFKGRKRANPPKGDTPGLGLDLIRASDVQQCPVDWLWRNRIARGKQTLIGGDPGVGKSQISLT